MTALLRPVTRELPVSIRDGGRSLPIAATLCREGLRLRQKGRRFTYLLPYEAAWKCAALLLAEQRRTERRGKKP